jgi:hypothetical protein
MPQKVYFDLSGQSYRVEYYPNGTGGPVVAGGPPNDQPSLSYTSEGLSVAVSGDNLKTLSSVAGTLVAAILQTNKIPGATTALSILIPGVHIDADPIPVSTVGIISTGRGVSNIGPGVEQTYKVSSLTGTAGILKQAQLSHPPT